jgi:ankyrin repeat protein
MRDISLFDATSAEEAQSLIAQGVDVNEMRNFSPLHFHANNPEIAAVLIEAGADVRAKGNFMAQTPLFETRYACVAKMMMDRGVDPNERNISHETPLHRMSRDHDAPAELSVSYIQALLDGGADPNARDHMGNTPLHSTSSKDVARALIAGGADTQRENTQGETPEQSWKPRCADVQSLNDFIRLKGAEHRAEKDRQGLEASVPKVQCDPKAHLLNSIPRREPDRSRSQCRL